MILDDLGVPPFQETTIHPISNTLHFFTGEKAWFSYVQYLFKCNSEYLNPVEQLLEVAPVALHHLNFSNTIHPPPIGTSMTSRTSTSPAARLRDLPVPAATPGERLRRRLWRHPGPAKPSVLWKMPPQRFVKATCWFIPLSKWVITYNPSYKWTLPPLIPFITRVITHLRFVGSSPPSSELNNCVDSGFLRSEKLQLCFGSGPFQATWGEPCHSRLEASIQNWWKSWKPDHQGAKNNDSIRTKIYRMRYVYKDFCTDIILISRDISP